MTNEQDIRRLDRIVEAVNEDLLSMTPEDVFEEARAEGEDTAAFAAKMPAFVKSAIERRV